MNKYRILNTYACLGGNRKEWDEVAKEAGIELEVTAIELDPELARMYQERFPNDKVIITDAHQYLLEHYKEYDFIWASPPCPTHGKVRMSQKNTDAFTPKYPDMKLYEEIIFLEHHFKGKYVVENVIPYYEPLIPGQKRDRHLYWTNFILPNVLSDRKVKVGGGTDEVNKLCKFHEIDISSYKGTQRKDKIARNLVDYKAGRTILETVFNIVKKSNVKQIEMF